MMGHRQVEQAALFYEFSLERHVPTDHLLRLFCRLGLDGCVPDHSTFSKNRHGRFRESDLLRRVFEVVLQRCIREGLVGGEGFAVDASLIKADANRQNGVEGEKGLPPEATGRAVEEYLAVLDDADR